MEGPSLVILREELEFVKSRKVTDSHGSAKIEHNSIKGKKLLDIRTFGKHLLLVFDEFSIRIHFLMFGSYRINEKKDLVVRWSLSFGKTEINFYSCAVSTISANLDDIYEWSADVMSDQWSPRKARKKLLKKPELNVGDALLDQTIFAGVGNIIKNEVLFRIKVHPESTIGSLPAKQLSALIREARNYSFDFMEWKRVYQLSKHWLIYKKKRCPQCSGTVVLRHTGKTPRRSFFCENCQRLYR